MATTYPTDPYSSAVPARGDYTDDQAITTTRVKNLRDCYRTVMERPFQLVMNGLAVSGSQTDYLFNQWKVYVPDWAAIQGASFVIPFGISKDGAISVSTKGWFEDNASGNRSNEVDPGDTSGAYVEYDFTLPIVSTWAGTVRTIEARGDIALGDLLGFSHAKHSARIEFQ